MKQESETVTLDSSRLCRDPIGLLASGFCTGLVPIAPGTAGTLLGVGLYFLLRELPVETYIVTIALLFGLGIWLTQHAAQRLAAHDHPAIVWDEIVGYLVTMAAAPRHFGWAVFGFVLFRLFDIVKPWPIRSIDRHVGGGVGIMLDDLVAGVYAWILLQSSYLGLKIVAS